MFRPSVAAGVDCNPAQVKRFAAEVVGQVGERCRGVEQDGGDTFVVTALFRIPKDQPLPAAPESSCIRLQEGNVALDPQ